MKKGEQKQLRAIIGEYQANCDRIKEIAETMKKENRERNDTEEQEYRALSRENEILRAKMSALSGPALTTEKRECPEIVLSRQLESGKKGLIKLVRAGEEASAGTTDTDTADAVDLMKTTAVDGTGIIAIDQQALLKPLREGLIYDKIGVTVMTGLPGTTIRWPKHGKAVAQWANEGERLEDSKVDFSKLETKPVRLGVPIPVTRELLSSSQGIVESVIREEMPAAIIDKINEAMFSTTGKYTAKDGSEKDLPVKGPFAGTTNTVTFAGAVPTRKELLKMKAKIAATGIGLDGAVWIVTEAMRAELEDTKVDAGSGRFLLENNMMLGLPVFYTHHIGDTNVGLGNFKYQAAGFFGPMEIGVDPYTMMRSWSTDFVLNTSFGTATLYEEAFVLGKCKPA